MSSPDPRSTSVSDARRAARAAPRALDGDALLALLVDACRERRGEDIVSLDVRPLVEYMDHLLIVTGRSKRQNQAIARHVISRLKREAATQPLSRSGLEEGTWICLDYVDVVLHLFDAPTRAHYDLELLWADAARTEHAPAGPGEVLPDEPELGDDDSEGFLT